MDNFQQTYSQVERHAGNQELQYKSKKFNSSFSPKWKSNQLKETIFIQVFF